MKKSDLRASAESAAEGKAAAESSSKRKRVAAKKVARKKAPRKPAAAKRPVDLDSARREMLRLVCQNSVAITQAVIADALEGKYLTAKFLFEMTGLCAVKGCELEDAAEQESLASLLLQKWQLDPAEGAELTEGAEVTPGMDAAAEAPVES